MAPFPDCLFYGTDGDDAGVTSELAKERVKADFPEANVEVLDEASWYLLLSVCPPVPYVSISATCKEIDMAPHDLDSQN